MPTSEKDAVGRSKLQKLRSHWPRTILAATALAIVMTAPAPAVTQDADKHYSDQSWGVESWKSWSCKLRELRCTSTRSGTCGRNRRSHSHPPSSTDVPATDDLSGSRD